MNFRCTDDLFATKQIGLNEVCGRSPKAYVMFRGFGAHSRLNCLSKNVVLRMFRVALVGDLLLNELLAQIMVTCVDICARGIHWRGNPSANLLHFSTPSYRNHFRLEITPSEPTSPVLTHRRPLSSCHLLHLHRQASRTYCTLCCPPRQRL